MPERLKFKIGNKNDLALVKPEANSILITKEGDIYLDTGPEDTDRIAIVDQAKQIANQQDVLQSAKDYADQVKKDLLGEDVNEAYDTLKEIADWINGNGVDAVELTEAIAKETKNREEGDQKVANDINNSLINDVILNDTTNQSKIYGYEIQDATIEGDKCTITFKQSNIVYQVKDKLNYDGQPCHLSQKFEVIAINVDDNSSKIQIQDIDPVASDRYFCFFNTGEQEIQSIPLTQEAIVASKESAYLTCSTRPYATNMIDFQNDKNYAIALGNDNKAFGRGAFVAGRQNWVHQDTGAAVGRKNHAGYCSFVSGRESKALAEYSSAFGRIVQTYGNASFATGQGNTTKGLASFACGLNNIATGKASFVAGYNNQKVIGTYAAAFGNSHQTVDGLNAFVSGFQNTTNGANAVCFGCYNQALANQAFTAGIGLIQNNENSIAFGSYNDNQTNNLFEIGNGNKDKRSNAFAVDKNGNAILGAEPTEDKHAATKQYVDKNSQVLVNIETDTGYDEAGNKTFFSPTTCKTYSNGIKIISGYVMEESFSDGVSYFPNNSAGYDCPYEVSEENYEFKFSSPLLVKRKDITGNNQIKLYQYEMMWGMDKANSVMFVVDDTMTELLKSNTYTTYSEQLVPFEIICTPKTTL